MGTHLFISYARTDGAALASRLHEDLARRGFTVWRDDDVIAGGESWTVAIETGLDAADVVLAVVTAASYRSEICRAEQLRSLRKGKCVIPLLADPRAEIPLHLETKTYRDFSQPGAYAERLRDLLGDIEARRGITLSEQYRTTRVTYVTAPPMVANYVDHPAAVQAIRGLLFTAADRRAVALTALEGMGGIGKTVLAQALCRDEVVQQAFPDGIVWIAAGRDSKVDVPSRMREVAKALGDDVSLYENPLAAENQYRTTIANRAALIVIDDVWNKAHLDPFLAESPRSRFLFTTRDAAIAKFTGARQHRVDLLDHTLARELLARWSGRPNGDLPPEADDVVHECGRLPLALSTVGALLAGASAREWKDTLALLREADVTALASQLPPGQESFFRAVEVSVNALAPDVQDAYVALAILLEGMAARPAVLQTLWNRSQRDAGRIARQLVDRSLAQRETADEDSIRLHDLQLDYVRARSPYREALPLIHGALRLAAHVVDGDARQFASQLTGRLLPHLNKPPVASFVAAVQDGSPLPWLRPLHSTLAAPGGALTRTLKGHAREVTGVALSADGTCAVSASEDSTLRVWDVDTGTETRILTGHTAAVSGVALSADGRLAVSTSYDQTLRLWDVVTGREQAALTGPSLPGRTVALSADGDRALSVSGDRTLDVWDVQSRQIVRALSHATKISTGVLSADGRRALMISADGRVYLWNVDDGRYLGMLEGHARASVLSADGQQAVTAGDDGRLKFCRLDTGHTVVSLQGHADVIYGLALTADGRRAVSASRDRTVKVWETASGREIRTLEGHSGPVTGVAVSNDGRRIVSASFDRTLKVWDVHADDVPQGRIGHTKAVNRVTASADGFRAVSASADGTLKVWDVRSGREARELIGHRRAVNSVAMTADGLRAVSASGDRTLKVWDVETGRLVHTLEGHAGYVLGVAIDADAGRAVSASSDHTLMIWDLPEGRHVHTLSGHTEFVSDVAMSADGRLAVSASWDRTLKVWDLEGRREIHTLAGHTHFVSGVTMSADGRIALSASWDQTIRVWDLESGRELSVLTGHASWVNGIDVTPDGRYAVSAGADHSVKVWDVAAGEALVAFTCDGVAGSCAFGDGRTIVTGDVLGGVHFLRLEA